LRKEMNIEIECEQWKWDEHYNKDMGWLETISTLVVTSQ
jgi:hypothetical protein